MTHLTAIQRTKPSAPARWLHDNGYLSGRTLDYGCGRGKDADAYGLEKYDPHYEPRKPHGNFDTILCTYVLNVIESHVVRGEIQRKILGLLVPGGKAYISVRADKHNLKGLTSRGTWQGYVELPCSVVWRCPGYVIYQMDG